jgi:mycofactocin glycosyltransferase
VTAAAPLPAGLPLVLDRSVRSHAGGLVLAGGEPMRALRLTPDGRAAVAALVDGTATADAALRLGRRLVDGGLAHPRPVVAESGAVTVVVPVRDRADALRRCLAALGRDALVLVVDDGSRDPAAIAAACREHGVAVLRRERAGGPGAARNAALARVTTDLVAFVDSDCEPDPGWLAALAGHFADPLVGAVAPRVRPAAPRAGAGACARFAAARSPLDMGPCPASVAPGGRVAYVPAAALVVRRDALGRGFDAGLRHGEDVDLVWRLHDAGWRVRYDPSAVVRHAEPERWPAWLGRRLRYGTAAAPLHRRHPGRLTPAVLRPWPAGAAALALAGRPGAASILVAANGALLARRVRGAGVPAPCALAWSAHAALRTAEGAGRAATALALPALVAAAASGRSRRARTAALALLAGPPLLDWARRRPALDPLRWTLACIADDAAYGAGVWRGCLREQTAGPLCPARRAPQ